LVMVREGEGGNVAVPEIRVRTVTEWWGWARREVRMWEPRLPEPWDVLGVVR